MWRVQERMSRWYLRWFEEVLGFSGEVALVKRSILCVECILFTTKLQKWLVVLQCFEAFSTISLCGNGGGGIFSIWVTSSKGLSWYIHPLRAVFISTSVGFESTIVTKTCYIVAQSTTCSWQLWKKLLLQTTRAELSSIPHLKPWLMHSFRWRIAY